MKAVLLRFVFWAGQAAPKIYLPRRHFYLPRHSVKQRKIWLCPKHYLPSGASQGLIQLAPLPFFCWIHLQLASGPVVILHAGCFVTLCFVFVDNHEGTTSESAPLFAMSGDGKNDVTIPIVFLFHKQGQQLFEAMAANQRLLVRLGYKTLEKGMWNMELWWIKEWKCSERPITIPITILVLWWF